MLTTIPVYYLCKNFVARKIAIIGASLIAFDPRLIINSFLGITDPLNLLLISISLVLFLSNNINYLLLMSLFIILNQIMSVLLNYQENQ